MCTFPPKCKIDSSCHLLFAVSLGPAINAPVAKPRSKLADNFVLPELPSVPDTLPSASAGVSTSSSDDIDFDDLSRRFEELKKKT